MRIQVYLYGMLAALISVALSFYYFGKGNANEGMLATGSELHAAYLTKRFELAYENEPAIIAVWEGTNLITYLTEQRTSSGGFTQGELASLLFMNARLSGLFRELGDTNNAEKFAGAAADWFCRISPRNTNNLSDVVGKTLERDRLKRAKLGSH